MNEEDARELIQICKDEENEIIKSIKDVARGIDVLMETWKKKELKSSLLLWHMSLLLKIGLSEKKFVESRNYSM
jgi:hypothetical protein